MNRRLSGDVSLNTPLGDEGDSDTWQDWLPDETPSQEGILADSEEAANHRKALAEALAVLDQRERRILEARRLAEVPTRLRELADEFGVSRERVRQIEMTAFQKLRKAVKHRIPVTATPEMVPAF